MLKHESDKKRGLSFASRICSLSSSLSSSSSWGDFAQKPRGADFKLRRVYFVGEGRLVCHSLALIRAHSSSSWLPKGFSRSWKIFKRIPLHHAVPVPTPCPKISHQFSSCFLFWILLLLLLLLFYFLKKILGLWLCMYEVCVCVCSSKTFGGCG